MPSTHSREETKKILAPAFLLLGLYLGSSSVPRALEVRALDKLEAETEAVAGECGSRDGGFVEIEVEGERHRCTVGQKCGGEGDLVAYDPADPSRCRGAEHRDGLGQYELVSLISALGFVLYGVVGCTVFWVRRRRKQAEVEAIVAGD